MNKELSRRKFLKLAGPFTAALLLGGCIPSTDKESVVLPDGSFLLQDGRIVRPNGQIVMPDGTIITADGAGATQPVDNQSETPTATPEGRDFSNWWPQTPEEFVKAVTPKPEEIGEELKIMIRNAEGLGIVVSTLRPDQVRPEKINDRWTGGWEIPPKRDGKTGQPVQVYIVKNPGPVFQFGFMFPPEIRATYGLTPYEIKILMENHGWVWVDADNDGAHDKVGSGVPVGRAILVEGATFYPFINETDSSGETHVLWLALGPNRQTFDQRETNNK